LQLILAQFNHATNDTLPLHRRWLRSIGKSILWS
jgi:hypothetical protein